METALTHLAPHLDRMTDGETGDRQLWITAPVDSFRVNPDVELVQDGRWTDYEDTARFRVRDGVTMNPENIGLRYALSFQGSFPAFKALRERFDRCDVRFQVGIPSPLDLALYAFGDVVFAEASIVDACTAATTREIGKVAELAGDDVVFQIETVVGLMAVAQAADPEQEEMAAHMADKVLDVVRGSPENTSFGFHLCLGDFHHKAYGNMRNVRPVMLLANAIAAAWPEGRNLVYIHAPFAAAAEPPVADESFYEPLTELDIGDDVRFVAGFLHESLDLEAHQQLLSRIERLAGRDVDVAAACGLGRRPSPEEAFRAMRDAADLIEAPRAIG